jgi:crotonobetainyl-CoA:carnitine CoA-transferase CaiB-like acyl-CoA transferase
VEIARKALIEWFLSKTMAEAADTLSKASVPCTEINTIAQAAASPQLSARELLVKVPDPIAGTIHVSGKYIKLSRSETVVGSPPVIGEHTDEILGSLLNYPPERLQQLRKEEVIR